MQASQLRRVLGQDDGDDEADAGASDDDVGEAEDDTDAVADAEGDVEVGAGASDGDDEGAADGSGGMEQEPDGSGPDHGPELANVEGPESADVTFGGDSPMHDA
jgi:hypothetical protein